MNYKVAIQGIKSSFHYEATKKYFGNNIEIIECSTFNLAAKTLSNRQANYCVMAIENSIAGSILTNYKLINDYNLKIIGETYLKIELHLMANKGVDLNSIKNILSHPMAIRQSEDFLTKFPKINIIEHNDTAACAKLIATDKSIDTAVIAGRLAAQEYDLKILNANIETNKLNYTRFLILKEEGLKLMDSNKASICFQLTSSIGSLAEVLILLKDYEIDITKIQSVPIPEHLNKYYFHLDLEYQRIENFQSAMAIIWNKVSKLSVLGEYKSASINVT